MPNSNSPEEVSQFLSPLWPILHKGLEIGVQRAETLEDTEWDDAERDPGHWGHSVRRRLRAHLLLPENAGEWRLNTKLQMAGVEISWGTIVLKVWTANPAGSGPRPPTSQTQRHFCSQQLSFNNMGLDGYIAYWSVNGQREVALGLCKPTGSWNYWQQAMLEWSCKIRLEPEGRAFGGGLKHDVPARFVLDPDDIRIFARPADVKLIGEK